jgi:ABC-type multidrug transport system fused ATPase/permease subunit
MKYFGSCFWTDTKEQLNTHDTILALAITVGITVLFAAAQAFRIAVDVLLVMWAKDGGYYFNLYVTCLCILLVLVLSRMVCLNTTSVKSSRNIHNSVFRHVMTAPIPTFFDTHTVGEVLNRFGKDMEIVDTSIPEFFLQFLINWFQVGSVFILCIWSTPYFLLFMLVLSFAFYKVYINFACVSRDLKRLESISRSPVYASFSETLNGLDTIRAYGDVNRFVSNHLKRMARNNKISFHMAMAVSYTTARLELMVSLVMFIVAFCAVFMRDSVSEVGAGMALVYTLQLTALFQRCVQLSIDIQAYFTSAERMFEYSTIPQEVSVWGDTADKAQLKQNDSIELVHSVYVIPVEWPSKGRIEFRAVELKYRDNEPVLRGLSFVVSYNTHCSRDVLYISL